MRECEALFQQYMALNLSYTLCRVGHAMPAPSNCTFNPIKEEHGKTDCILEIPTDAYHCFHEILRLRLTSHAS